MADRFLALQERQGLMKTLEKVLEVRLGPGARAGFLVNAGLGRFVSSVNLAAEAPRLFAQDLVPRLEEFGFLPEEPSQPHYHALGALIDYVRQISDTPADDAKFLAGLMVKYQLIAEPAYLDELKNAYQLDVAPVPQPEPVAVPPAITPVVSEEPPFDPVVGNQEVLEQIVNSADNFLDIDVLAGAIYSAQAVGRVELPAGTPRGTGFLIGPNLLLTNQHVLKTKSVLEAAVVRFDYHENAAGARTTGRVFKIDPSFYESSPDVELDYALVRLVGEPLAERKMSAEEAGLSYLELLRRGRHRGYLVLAPRTIVEHERVNIIQHPNGDPEKVVLTQNYVLANMSETRVHYLADTLPGSSGSPVLNRNWEVVALHHSGGEHPPQKASTSLQQILKGQFKFNEGIPMKAILPKIEGHLPVK